MEFGKVAVLMGGKSGEREISLISGKAVLEALRSRGVDAHAFDPAVRPVWDLAKEGFARAFLILHGRFGEDGTIQGALETLGIPYTGRRRDGFGDCRWTSGAPSSSGRLPACRRRRFRPAESGIPISHKSLPSWGLPLFVKPAREGSSIGVTKVESIKDLAAAFQLAHELDPLVIAEEFVAGQELTAAVLGGQAIASGADRGARRQI